MLFPNYIQDYPKMGQFENYILPMTFNNFKTKDVVMKTSQPGFITIFDKSYGYF